MKNAGDGALVAESGSNEDLMARDGAQFVQPSDRPPAAPRRPPYKKKEQSKTFITPGSTLFSSRRPRYRQALIAARGWGLYPFCPGNPWLVTDLLICRLRKSEMSWNTSLVPVLVLPM